MKKVTTLFSAVFIALFSVVSLQAQDLFFSEFIEGSGNNKAFEIFNPTDAAVDLGDYIVLGNYNGNPYNDTLRFPAGTMLESMDVFVVAHNEADSAIVANADSLIQNPYAGGTSYIAVFNGDDARGLFKISGTDTTLVDVFGTTETDPGSGWDVSGVAAGTKDHTLVRKPAISVGNTTPTASFGTDAVTSEWIVTEQDDLSNLGFHNMDVSESLTDVPGNVVSSWDFEDMSLGLWGNDNNPDYGVGGSVEVSADIAASGDYSVKVSSVDTLVSTGLVTTDISGLGIQAGDTLYYRVWVPESDTSEIAGLQPYTQSGNSWQQWSDVYVTMADITPNAWNWIKVGVPEPADGVFQKAGFQITGAADASTPTIYIDDIALVRPESNDPVTVTFMVNTATIPDTVSESSFVQVRGELKATLDSASYGAQNVTWGDDSTPVAENAGGDYWMVDVTMAPGDSLVYKYWVGLDASTGAAPNGGWEANGPFNGNYLYVLPEGTSEDVMVDLAYYNIGNGREAPFETSEDSVAVYFRVNVGFQVQDESFNPETDQIGVRGNPAFFDNPDDWGSSAFFLEQDYVSGDNYVYSGATKVHKDSVANFTDDMAYKFVIEQESGTVLWEDRGDRFFSVPDADTTLHMVYFSDDPPSDAKIIDTNLNFEVNVGILEGLGYFNSAIDTVAVTGTFNGWDNSSDRMSFNSFSGTYESNPIPLTSAVGAEVAYKYYIKWDASRDDEDSENYFPLISANDDGWEEPGVTGGGNRLFTVQDMEDQPTQSEFFNSVPPEGLITESNTEGGSLTVTFRVDMDPATNTELARPFDPANDSVFISVETPFFALTNDLPTYSDDIATRSPELLERMMFSDEDGDMIYELDFELTMPTLNHFGFNIVFGEPTAADGEIVQAGPGGTQPGRRYYQYVTPNVAQDGDDYIISWPSTFTFPILEWEPEEDLPFELPPDYTKVNVSNEVKGDAPEEFSLAQNYPNPFNPTTNIRFNLAKSVDVNLTVYNLLGQKVKTLISNKKMGSGTHTVAFDASSLSSGVYFYRLTAGDFVSNKRMTLIK